MHDESYWLAVGKQRSSLVVFAGDMHRELLLQLQAMQKDKWGTNVAYAQLCGSVM